MTVPQTSTLHTPSVSALLEKLFAAADRDDPAAFSRAKEAMTAMGAEPSTRERAEIMRDVYMPVSPEVGRLLYMLARARPAPTIVEFGTSFGLSGIHLAAALRDGGGGRLITTEIDPVKAERARINFATAGLSDLIDLRLGDAFETLRTVGKPVALLVLDGWKNLYLPLLQMLEPQLAPGALIVADDLAIAPDALAPYLAYVRAPANRYVSVELPLGDTMEVSLRV
jgi:predicted O-methyltransferase YrrM